MPNEYHIVIVILPPFDMPGRPPHAVGWLRCHCGVRRVAKLWHGLVAAGRVDLGAGGERQEGRSCQTKRTWHGRGVRVQGGKVASWMKCGYGTEHRKNE